MKIEYREGDLFTTDIKHIVHGCNAQGVMGSGVAGILHEKYPEVFAAYRASFDARGLELGDTIWARTDDEEYWFGNMITQEDFGSTKSILYASYEAIEHCMVRLDAYMEGRRDACLDKMGEVLAMESVAMPAIGAGRANGDWKLIASIIERRSTRFQPIVYYRKVDGHPMDMPVSKAKPKRAEVKEKAEAPTAH